MKKRMRGRWPALFILIIITCLLSRQSYSQSLIISGEKARYEVGFNVGPSFFLGDLGGHRGKGKRFVKDLNFPLTEIMTGGFITCYPNKWLGIRVAAQYGKLSGEDNIINTKGTDELYRKQRNLDFRTNITEAYVAFEVFPTLLLNLYEPDFKPRVLPYGVDRKSTRLNSSHMSISYAVFCL